MSEISSFEEQVEAVNKALKNMLDAQKENANIDSGKWLETLFKHYSDRMLSDNERIWRTGALFVPISLAAFAALANIKCLMFWHTLILGVPSFMLMYAWIVIAENHRAFQQKSEAWLIAIQRAMNLEAPRQVKAKAGGREGWVTKKGAIQRMRWNLLFMVGAAWIIIIIASAFHLLPSPCQN